MEGIFDKVDGQVVFVVIALIVAAIQALAERRKKQRAERELLDDTTRRAAERGGTIEPGEDAGTFEDLYDEYRREILGDQQREPTEPEGYEAPWQPPGARPGPPPVPPPIPTAAVPASPVEPASQGWQAPSLHRAEDRLNEVEKAALAAFNRRSPAKSRPTSAPHSVRGLLANPSTLRHAVILREILGPPKGM